MLWRNRFLAVIYSTALGCGVIVSIAIVYGTLVLAIYFSGVKSVAYSLGFSKIGDLIDQSTWSFARKPKDQNFDLFNARSDQINVQSWVLGCIGDKVVSSLPISVLDLPPSLQDSFVQVDDSSQQPRDGDRPAIYIRPGERELIALNKALSDKRVELSAKADAAYNFWAISSLVTILLGMLTTILVSLSATKLGRDDGRTQTIIRVLAIVFPALGTGSAAVIAFYGPQVEWSQSSRTLARLTQLHGEIAVGIWKYDCFPNKREDVVTSQIAKVLDEWSKRYLENITVSDAATAASSSNAGTGAAVPAPAASAPAK